MNKKIIEHMNTIGTYVVYLHGRPVNDMVYRLKYDADVVSKLYPGSEVRSTLDPAASLVDVMNRK